MRRITKAAIGGLTGCALALGGTQVAMSAVDYFLYPEDLAEGGQVELEEMVVPGPFVGASADLRLKVSPTGSNFKLEVSGIAESGTGSIYGAHLHTHDCLDSSTGTRGGPHYNHEVHGVVPSKKFPSSNVPVEEWAEVSSETEVWFSFAPNAHGKATADATVPFVPVDPDGAMSVVIHEKATITDPALGVVGSAGGRQACFPLSVSGVFPTIPTG